MVWLHTVPDKKEFSRLEDLELEGKQINYPEITNSYLIKILYEDLGACTSNGNGLAPLSWGEIEAWQRQTGTKLLPYEVDILKKASEAYVSQTVFAKDPKCLPPLREIVETTQEDISSMLDKTIKVKKHGY